MNFENPGKLIIISAPSGTGKGTVIKELLKKNPDLNLAVSATTRQPRDGEVNGENYYFLEKVEFEKMILNDEFLEYAEYCGNFYGTPKFEVKNKLIDGKSLILEIEINGWKQVKKALTNVLSIFIMPPSEKELCSRLLNRALDNENAVNERLLKAKSEIQAAKNFDYVVVNDNIVDCTDKILKILKKCAFNFASKQPNIS